MNEAIVTNPPFPKNYAPDFLVLVDGKGVWLTDRSGGRYMDFGSGIAVNALGYGNERLAEVAAEQMKKLIHVSNLYTTEPALELAEKLIATGPFAAVHFGNSGSEANETAIKYARLYAHRTKGEGHHRILSFTGAFHGRTLGALSSTFTPKYQDPFKPLVPGFDVCPYNDTETLEKSLDGSFAAVIVEVVQGEGGLSHIEEAFASALNRLCRENDVILIADEVQTGLARTGSLYAYQWAGLQPDIVTLAKPLAAGLPLSATLIPERINELLHVGEHGTTFGGGPVTTAVALEVWKTLANPEFINGVAEMGRKLRLHFDELKRRHNFLGAVKGAGLLSGLEVDIPDPSTLIPAAKDEGLLVLRSGTNVLRVAPPLIITEDELAEGIDRLDRAFRKLGGG
jgi:acetylornithine/N-succinyldiaminopimelate aminotransferase